MLFAQQRAKDRTSKSNSNKDIRAELRILLKSSKPSFEDAQKKTHQFTTGEFSYFKKFAFSLFSNIIISSCYKTKSSALANKHLTSKNKNKKSHTTKQTTSSREKASLGSLDS